MEVRLGETCVQKGEVVTSYLAVFTVIEGIKATKNTILDKLVRCLSGSFVYLKEKAFFVNQSTFLLFDVSESCMRTREFVGTEQQFANQWALRKMKLKQSVLRPHQTTGILMNSHWNLPHIQTVLLRYQQLTSLFSR